MSRGASRTLRTLPGRLATVATLFILAPACSARQVVPTLRSDESVAQPGWTERVSFDASEGMRLAFDVSPDGTWLVFDLLGQLWRVPIEGGNAVPLTDAARDTAEDLDPSISPDGLWIAFQGDRPAARVVWLMPAVGGAPRALTRHEIGYFAYAGAAWSPDGRFVAHAVRDTLGIVEVESGEERVLRIDSLPPLTPAHPRIPNNGSPAWSPDGERIAFVNSRGDNHVWEVHRDGGAARRLTRMRAAAPAYSPRGDRLAFIGRDSANRPQVFVQDLATGHETQLSSAAELVSVRVRWLPDGESLVYAADGRLWRIPATGGAAREIPFTARVDFERRRAALRPVRFPEPGVERSAIGFRMQGLVLSPDGRRVAIAALDSVWVWPLDAAPVAVASAPRGADWLAWSPDGRQLAWWTENADRKTFDLHITDAIAATTRRAAALPSYPMQSTWSPDGRYIAFAHARRARLLDARGEFVDDVAKTRDLGAADTRWGGLAWNDASDALLAYSLPLWEPGTPVMRGVWLPLEGEPQPVARFPRALADLRIGGGYAVYVHDNLLWRVPFQRPAGMSGEPAMLGGDAAINATYASDGSILYLSAEGPRIRRPNGSTETFDWPLRHHVRRAPEPLLIRNARLIDGSGDPPNGLSDVHIESGRIMGVASAGALAVPAGTREVDVAGRSVLPGLLDMHAHLWTEESARASLHNGVTTLRDIGSQRGLSTADMRNLVEAGLRSGSRIVFAGAMFHGGSGPTTASDQMTEDGDAIARGVLLNRAIGAEYTKERSHARWHAGARVVTESHRHGMPVSGHCGHIIPLVAAGMDGREHVRTCYRDQAILRQDFARLTTAARMWITATAGLYYGFVAAADDPTLIEHPGAAPFMNAWLRGLYGADSIAQSRRASYAANHERYVDSARRYHQAGATILAGTDSPFPLALQLELETLVAAGLTPMEAILAATSRAAQAMNAPDIGVIAPGRLADIVVVDGDPLADIRSLRDVWMVIQGGRVVER